MPSDLEIRGASFPARTARGDEFRCAGASRLARDRFLIKPVGAGGLIGRISGSKQKRPGQERARQPHADKEVPVRETIDDEREA